MPERHVVRAALAMRTLAQRTARQAATAPQRAVVVGLAPLQVEMTQGGLTLDSSQFTLAHSVRKYDAQYGLAVGDTLLMTPVAGGDLVATTVIAAATSTSGFAKQMTEASGSIGGTPLVGKVAFLDEAGDLVGYAPLI